MISALQPSAAEGMTILAAFAVLGPLVAWWLAQRRRAAGVLAGVALVGVLALTLSPTSRTVSIGCAVDWSPQLTASEPLANVLMLVPFALLVAVATGRPLLAALTGSALSVGIETVQAFATTMGRACDTSDWIANTTGAAIGATLAAVGIAFARWHEASSAADERSNDDRPLVLR